MSLSHLSFSSCLVSSLSLHVFLFLFMSLSVTWVPFSFSSFSFPLSPFSFFPFSFFFILFLTPSFLIFFPRHHFSPPPGHSILLNIYPCKRTKWDSIFKLHLSTKGLLHLGRRPKFLREKQKPPRPKPTKTSAR